VTTAGGYGRLAAAFALVVAVAAAFGALIAWRHLPAAALAAGGDPGIAAADP
jgi:hypothetical protein